MKRPRGVTYLALVFGIFGVLLLPVAFLNALRFAAAGGVVNTGLALLGILFPQLLIVGSYGLWKLKPWGLLVAGVALMVSATTALAAAASAATGGAIGAQVLRFGLSLAAIGYLLTPTVRYAFAGRSGAAAGVNAGA